MNERQLHAVLAVKETGSIGKAAERLFLSRQALKKELDTLEQELGFQILRRSHTGVTLTPAGEEFCRGAEKTLQQMLLTMERSRKIAQNQSVLRIDNPMHPRLLLERMMNEFARRYPEIRQEVFLYSNGFSPERVRSGETDVSEGVFHASLPMEGLCFTKIRTLCYACLMTETHPLAKRSEVTLEELSGMLIGIGVKRKNEELVARLERACRGYTLRENTPGQPEAQFIYNICLNQGVFLTKAYYARQMHPLVAVPLASELALECGIFYRDHPSREVQLFVDLAREMYPQEKE